jgi:hypothetical protein
MRPLRYFCSIHLVVLAVLLCLLASGGCGNRQGLAKLRPCRLPGIDDEVLCRKFRVFENRQTRAGRTIDLNVVVLPALDPKNKAEPLFDFAGGRAQPRPTAQYSMRPKAKNIDTNTTSCWSINGERGNRIR